MVRYAVIVAGFLLLHIHVYAAPRDTLNIEDSKKDETKIEIPIAVNQEPLLDSIHSPEEENSHKESSAENVRQKRFYNFYGYGVPPMNPIIYPSNNKRDQSFETGVYGFADDPLEHIQKRLQIIANSLRQPIPPPPPPSPYPLFFPVIYIPVPCDCYPNNDNIPSATENPPTVDPQTQKPNMTVDERFPQLDDERQNWGLITNETDPEYDEEDFSRPISFDPIQPSRPTMRPAPPVDHGSSQGNSQGPQTTTTTTTSRPRTRPSTTAVPASRPEQSTYLPFPQVPRNEPPTTCDGAILSCCHQQQITYDCFIAQGCPDTTSYGNPCDSLVILQVIDKFQKYYGVRNGK